MFAQDFPLAVQNLTDCSMFKMNLFKRWVAIIFILIPQIRINFDMAKSV